MADFANLVLGVDTRGLKKGERALDDTTRAGRKTERTVDKTGDAFTVAGAKSRASTSMMSDGMKRATAAAVLLSVAVIGTASLRAAEQYAKMTNGLKAMGASSSEAAMQLNALTDISLRTRAPLDATAQLYTRISIAADELGASQQEVLRFTENVGLALGAAGIGANEASGALMQLSQAMSGGVVRAEEFNSILENAFPLAQAAARGIDAAGGSVGRLRQLVVDGKVSSEDFFDAILSQGDALQETFANTEITIGQATTNIGTAFTSLIGTLDQMTGSTSAIASGINFLAQNMEAVTGIIIAATGALVIGFTPAIVSAGIATATWVAGLVTLKAALIATGIGAVVVGVGLLIGMLIKARRQTESFGNAFKVIALQVKAASLNMKAFFISAIGSMAFQFVEFTWTVADGLNNLFGTSLMGASAVITQELNRSFLATEAAANAATAAANALKTEVADVADESAGTEAALKQLAEAAGAGKGGLATALDDAGDAAEDLGKAKAQILVSGIDSMSSAFGDFVSGGLKDFKSFASSIVDTFKRMLSQMIAMAVKNKIIISLGMGGAGAGAAAGGGVMSGLLGGFGTAATAGSAAVAGTGFLGGLGSVGSGLMSGGLSGGAGALTTALSGSGGLMAAAGAAILPLAAVFAVVSFFKSKTKTIDEGIKGVISMEDAAFQSFQKIEKSRFFGLSKKRSTITRTLSAGPMDQAAFLVRESVVGAAESLGVSSSIFDGFTHSFSLSLKGLNEAAKSAAISKEFARMGESLANLVPHIDSVNQLFAVAQNRVALTDRLLQAQGKTEELTAIMRVREMDATNEHNKALLAQIFAAEDAAAAVNKLSDAMNTNENAFATGVDFRRGLSRAANNIAYSPEKSQAEMLAELKSLNARIDVLQSTSEITANSSSQTAENTDYTNALTLEAAT